MTFLEICQMLARESGTIDGNLPLSVNNQTGRLLSVVRWTQEAWRQIQNRRNSWLWMRGEFEGVTAPGTKRYTPAAMNIERFASWRIDDDTMTVYRQDDGRADERVMLFLPWEDWKRRYDRGVQERNRPLHFTVSPAGELCIGPEPDGLYVVRGEYRKGLQPLVENDDRPEMPERFHDLIAWYGLLLLAEHDEAELHITIALRRFRDLLEDLERDQLPTAHLGGGPLA